MAENSNNPYGIDGPHFNADMYFQKLIKVSLLFLCDPILYQFDSTNWNCFLLWQECTLKQIMDHETEIIKNTQTLHSDMQTLVYENYNKFISATDTIRKVNNAYNVCCVNYSYLQSISL